MKYLPVAPLASIGQHRSEQDGSRPPSAVNLYGNAAERNKHRRQIEALCERGGYPRPVVSRLYASVLADMRPAARITDYLPIFVSRRVQHLLRP